LFFLIAAIDLRTQSVATRSVFGGGLLLVLLLQIATLLSNWRSFDKTYDNLWQVTRHLTPGDALLYYVMGTERFSHNLSPPLEHAPSLLIADRRIFVQSMFAHYWQQPLRYTARGSELIKKAELSLIYPHTAETLPTSPVARERLLGFDYVLIGRFEKFPWSMPASTELVEEAGIFRLYRVMGNDQ
jgi:hypothetical protein